MIAIDKIRTGEKAPNFTAMDQDEQIVSLSELQGKKVILFFYPKDDTPACTRQACNLRDNYSVLKEKGFHIFGISPDKPAKHRKYKDKYSFPFTLISDPDKEILNDYGLWGPKQFMGRTVIGVYRTTIIINEKGIVEHVIDKVRTKDHAQQILEVIE